MEREKILRKRKILLLGRGKVESMEVRGMDRIIKMRVPLLICLMSRLRIIKVLRG